MRLQKLFAAAAVVALFGSARAIDAPHDGSFSSGSCDSCHKLHSSTGGTLTGYNSNNDACITCHNTSPSLGSNNQLGLPWDTLQDQAVPGTGGQHHRWDAAAVSALYGAKLPTNVEMLNRIAGGTLQCATCHDPHADVSSFAPGSVHSSMPFGVDTNNTSGSGLGKLRVVSVGAGAPTFGYRVRIDAPGQALVSRNFGKASPTWFGPIPYTLNTPFSVDTVSLVLSGAPAAGDYWDFYVSYPHLRQTNVADAMCVQCHADRVQSHTVVGAQTTDGTTFLSHPVGAGVTLGANGGGYDLTPATMLDATGVAQVTGDGNRTNDLVLDGGTTMRCTTCHAPHNADSNSLTVDLR